MCGNARKHKYQSCQFRIWACLEFYHVLNTRATVKHFLKRNFTLFSKLQNAFLSGLKLVKIKKSKSV